MSITWIAIELGRRILTEKIRLYASLGLSIIIHSRLTKWATLVTSYALNNRYLAANHPIWKWNRNEKSSKCNEKREPFRLIGINWTECWACMLIRLIQTETKMHQKNTVTTEKTTHWKNKSVCSEFCARLSFVNDKWMHTEVFCWQQLDYSVLTFHMSLLMRCIWLWREQNTINVCKMSHWILTRMERVLFKRRSLSRTKPKNIFSLLTLFCILTAMISFKKHISAWQKKQANNFWRFSENRFSYE